MIQDNENSSENSSVNNNENNEAEVKPKEKVAIEFPYSELIRSQVPKTFELVEKVVTDWKHEGDFSDLGIVHPVAGILASQALQKAKSIEQSIEIKLEEKGIFSIAKMGLEIVKAQVENIKTKIQK